MVQRIRAKDYVKPTKFIKLEPGETRVRLLSDLYVYREYGVKAGGRYISQIVRENEPINPIFLRSEAEPKLRWGWVAYDFKAQRLGLLTVGPMLGDQLGELTKAKPDEYKKLDVLITRKGKTMRDTEYTAKWATDVQEMQHPDREEYRMLLEHFEGKPDPKTGEMPKGASDANGN